jgi:hypothetical protein
VKDKAEIEKLKAELAALRKKASEEESRRLRGEKEKAALEIEAVAKSRNETETLKVCIRSALVIVCMYVCMYVCMCFIAYGDPYDSNKQMYYWYSIHIF